MKSIGRLLSSMTSLRNIFRIGILRKKPHQRFEQRTLDFEILEERVVLSGGLDIGSPTNIDVPRNPAGIVMGDFNGDGNLDLATASGLGSNTFSVLLGDGTGQFGAPTSTPAGLGANHPAVGDFDKDGNLDLVVANVNSSNVSIFLGDGAGGFGASTDFPAESGATAPVVVDFNGDGNLDLAVPTFLANDISVLLGNGKGGFGPTAKVAAGTRPAVIAVADFDEDGILDMVSANANDISVLLGDGNGGFGLPTFITVDTPDSPTVGDFNGDGDLDIAVASRNSNKISVLLGNGTGSFAVSSEIDVGTTTTWVISADLNGDGNLDLATANPTFGNISVLLGDGTGGFGPPTSFGTDQGSSSIVIGDFNGDRNPDLAVVNNKFLGINMFINSISVFLNLAPTATVTSAPNVDSSSNPNAYDFSITYTDNTAIDVSTLDDMDIRVNGPNGFDQPATFVSVDNPSDGSPRTATYRITPPAGNWDPSDIGTYTISVEPLRIDDTGGASVRLGSIGTFQVTICQDPIPTTGLVISGTGGDDTFILNQNGDGTLNVDLNSTDLGNFSSPGRITIASLCGNDTIKIANPVTVPIHVDGGSDFDVLDLSALNIELTVRVGQITDRVITFENIEHINAGQADDTFVFLPGADLTTGFLDGMAGTDILDFSRLNAPITANLETGTLGGVTLSNLEKVRGSLFQSTNVTPGDAVISFGLSFLSTNSSQSTNSLSDGADDSDDSRRNFTNNGGVTSSTSAESFQNPDTPPEDNGSDAPLDATPESLDSGLSTLDPDAIDEIMVDYI